jgi:Arc/MetJ-type ribon-helix-helix transcriptional regulator
MREGKISVSARIDPDLVNWVDDQVDKRRFRTRSHALEYALFVLKQSETMNKEMTI